MFKKVALLAFLGLIPALANSEEHKVIVLDSRTNVFQNTDCKANHTCSLIKAEHQVENYKIWVIDGYSHGTRRILRYQTDSLATLEDYLVVQFMRGCMYDSRSDGFNVATVFRQHYRHFGKIVPLHFNNWIIDTDNPDPAYSSLNVQRWSDSYGCASDKPDPECKALNGPLRYFLWTWNTVPGSTDKATRKFYGFTEPPTPELYITDHPGRAAFVMGDDAQNISLQFRTCIYKAADVPATMTPEDSVNFAKPIHCFEWSASHIYNHATEQFEHLRGVSPVCQ